MIKGLIQEEDITIINIYIYICTQHRSISIQKTNAKGEVNSNTIIVGDFNTLLTPTDRSSR